MNGSATISLSTQFIKGAREGTIFAKGTLLRKGRQIAFLEAVVTDEKGLVLTHCQGSFLIMSKPPSEPSFQSVNGGCLDEFCFTCSSDTHRVLAKEMSQ